MPRVLVVGADDMPRRERIVAAGEHRVARPAVVLPMLDRGLVERAVLPLLERIRAAVLQTLLLLVFADVEKVFEELDPRSLEQPLEGRHRLEKFLVFVLSAEPHDALDPGAVVPAAVEDHHFLGGREIVHVALEIPRAAVALGRLAQGDHPGLARAEMCRDRLYGPILARGVATLADD